MDLVDTLSRKRLEKIVYAGKVRVLKKKREILLEYDSNSKGLILVIGNRTKIVEIYGERITIRTLDWKPKAIYPSIFDYVS